MMSFYLTESSGIIELCFAGAACRDGEYSEVVADMIDNIASAVWLVSISVTARKRGPRRLSLMLAPEGTSIGKEMRTTKSSVKAARQ